MERTQQQVLLVLQALGRRQHCCCVGSAAPHVALDQLVRKNLQKYCCKLDAVKRKLMNESVECWVCRICHGIGVATCPWVLAPKLVTGQLRYGTFTRF